MEELEQSLLEVRQCQPAAMELAHEHHLARVRLVYLKGWRNMDILCQLITTYFTAICYKVDS